MEIGKPRMVGEDDVTAPAEVAAEERKIEEGEENKSREEVRLMRPHVMVDLEKVIHRGTVEGDDVVEDAECGGFEKRRSVGCV